MPEQKPTVCTKCGARLREKAVSCQKCGQPVPAPLSSEEISSTLIRFGADEAPKTETQEEPEAHKTVRRTLTGELIETEDGDRTSGDDPAGAAGLDQPREETETPDISPASFDEGGERVMVLTFCKACGQQNDEGSVKCRKCGRPLEVVTVGSVGEVGNAPRVWFFDVLGAVWVILGFAAVYCGVFLLKTDPSHVHVTPTDYLWTGVVVCAPGIMVVLRHYFCRFMFWTLTLISAIIWPLLALFWITGHLAETRNNLVGLIWLALFSGLSVLSFYTVRANDAFDNG